MGYVNIRVQSDLPDATKRQIYEILKQGVTALVGEDVQVEVSSLEWYELKDTMEPTIRLFGE